MRNHPPTFCAETAGFMRPRDGNVTARCRRGAAGGTGGAGSRFQISLLWRQRRINVDNTEFSTFSTGFSTGTFLNGFYRTFAYLLDITRIPFPLATLHFLHFRNLWVEFTEILWYDKVVSIWGRFSRHISPCPEGFAFLRGLSFCPGRISAPAVVRGFSPEHPKGAHYA